MLKQLILFEKKTLTKGFLVCVICIFPCTFVPVVLSSNNSFNDFLNRVPQSFLYTILFASFVVMTAVISNYLKLQAKEALFKKPAFKSLGFRLQLEGMNSIVKELSLFLIGMHEKMLYKIDIAIDDHDVDKHQIRICPLLIDQARKNRELVSMLKKYYRVATFDTFCVLLTPQPFDLDDPTYLRKHLTVINSEIQRLETTSNNNY